MSRVLLIKPRFLVGFDMQHIAQPLGLMYIGSMLKEAGHESKIHDCFSDYKDLRLLRKTIQTWKPDFIGISIIITELGETKRIMDLIRAILPDVPVTFGGPWPSANPEEAIRNLGADFVVLGEGEFVFPELIRAINLGLNTESIPGTASLVNGNITINQQRFLTDKELNALPFPSWELLDNNLYAKMHSSALVGCRPYMTIITSRGCPYKCAYCHQTMGKVFRKRSVESVLAEMEKLYFDYGFKEFEIIDDCFNLDLQRMRAILTGIRDKLGNVKLHFPGGVRADILEPKDMTLFKQAGTVSVFFAIETASTRLQKKIHKNLNIKKTIPVINASVRAGIYSVGFFMIGFPTETYEEACATADFAASTTLHRAYFFKPMPFTGTELAEMAADLLENKNKKIDPQKMNYFNSTQNISAMSDNELKKVFKRAFRLFYLNPKRLGRIIIVYPDILALPKRLLVTLLKILPEKRYSV